MGGSPCSVLVNQISESAKPSASDLGNRSFSTGRQRPQQSPSQNVGGIFSFGPPVLVRKRRSLIAPHAPPLSVVDVHGSSVKPPSEHAATHPMAAYLLSSSNHYNTFNEMSSPTSTFNVTRKVLPTSNEKPTGDSMVSEVTPAIVKEDYMAQHSESATQHSTTTTEIITDLTDVRGPNHNYYKQNIIRRMQQMIMAGHMSESLVFGDLDGEKTLTNVSNLMSPFLTAPDFNSRETQNQSKSNPIGVKFENNSYEMQSDFPAPPLIREKYVPLQLRKVETIIHPFAMKRIKTKNKTETLSGHIIGSVVRVDNPIQEGDDDSEYDDVEIFKLENFEQEVKEAVDEEDLKKLKGPVKTPLATNVTPQITVQNSIQYAENKSDSTEKIIESTAQPVDNTESSTRNFTPQPSLLSNPSVMSLTLPDDRLHGSGNRLIVNVTIATGGTANLKQGSNPVYVLSLSIPTGNTTGDINIQPVIPNLQNSVKPNNVETNTIIPGFVNRGGECQCSCPYLTNSNTLHHISSSQSLNDTFSGNSSESEQLDTVEEFNATMDYSTTTDVFTFSESTTADSLSLFEMDTTKNFEIDSTWDYARDSSSSISDTTEDSSPVDIYFVNNEISTENNPETNVSALGAIKTNIEETTEKTLEMITSTTAAVECAQVTCQPPTVLILEGNSAFGSMYVMIVTAYSNSGKFQAYCALTDTTLSNYFEHLQHCSLANGPMCNAIGRWVSVALIPLHFIYFTLFTYILIYIYNFF